MGAHLERARLLFNQGRYAQAEQSLREELAVHPHWGPGHSFLGRCLSRQNRHAEALEFCQEGVRLAPQEAYPHYMLGLILLDRDDLEGAEAALREALRIEPRNVDQLEWLSWVLYRRERRLEALEIAEQGLEIDPEHVGCLNRVGFYLRVLGRWRQSEEVLRTALKLAPENAYAHANLGWTLWTKAYRLADGVPPLFRSWAAARQSATAEAHRHFLESLRLSPGWEWAKSGAADTLIARRKAVVQPLLIVALAGFGLLTFWLTSLAPGDDKSLIKIETLFLIAGAGLIVPANGPAYLAALRSRLGPALLSPARRLAAQATVGCLMVAAVAAVASLFTPPPAALAVLFLGLAMVRPITAACEAAPGPPQTLMTLYAAVLGMAGCALAVCIVPGPAYSPGAPELLVLVGGVFGSYMAPMVAADLAKKFPKRTA